MKPWFYLRYVTQFDQAFSEAIGQPFHATERYLTVTRATRIIFVHHGVASEAALHE